MDRVTLGNGRWFDVDSARCWGEDTNFDGNNFISVNTGSQWDHECLYRTPKGVWILHDWSQWQGSGPGSYDIISESDAAAWLVRNGKKIPKIAQSAVAALEIA